MARLLRERLGDEGPVKIVDAIAEALEAVAEGKLKPGEDLPPVLQWYLDREYPKPKAVEISGPEGAPMSVERKVSLNNLSPEDRAEAMRLAHKAIDEAED